MSGNQQEKLMQAAHVVLIQTKSYHHYIGGIDG